MHLLITDSGLGGLAVCAATARALGASSGVRITYFNAWPEQESGFNDMPDIASRAIVLDRALAAMARLQPDRIVIACNTLSVVYPHTTFSRTARVPVLGIVDAGVGLFHEALCANPRSSIALFGTRTTMESAAHREALIEKGIASHRIATFACHGLARAIETDPDGSEVAAHIDRCTNAAAGAAPRGDILYFGVCCTHYTYIKDEIRTALEQRSRRTVHTLDPGDRLVAELMRAMDGSIDVNPAEAGSRKSGEVHANEEAPSNGGKGRPGEAAVSVVSKVQMDERKRRFMAARIEPVSPVTAAALMSYTRVPDLF